MIRFNGHGKEEEKEKKRSKLIKGVSLLSQRRSLKK